MGKVKYANDATKPLKVLPVSACFFLKGMHDI